MIESASPRGSLAVPSRRRFLLGAGAFLAAPAIVRVANIMPVSVVTVTPMSMAEMVSTCAMIAAENAVRTMAALAIGAGFEPYYLLAGFGVDERSPDVRRIVSDVMKLQVPA